MNRYVAEGIVSDLEGGSRIGVLVSKYDTVQNVLYQITEYTDEEFIRVEFAYRRIRHESGGVVHVFPDTMSARGLSLDVLVIPHGSASEFPLQLDPRTELIEY